MQVLCKFSNVKGGNLKKEADFWNTSSYKKELHTVVHFFWINFLVNFFLFFGHFARSVSWESCAQRSVDFLYAEAYLLVTSSRTPFPVLQSYAPSHTSSRTASHTLRIASQGWIQGCASWALSQPVFVDSCYNFMTIFRTSLL